MNHRIERRLVELGMTPRGASIAVTGKPDLLRMLFSGRIKSVKGDVLERLATVLNVSPQWLLTGKDTPVTPKSRRAPELGDAVSIVELDVRVGAGAIGQHMEHFDPENLPGASSELIRGRWNLPARVLAEMRV
ncbi:MAG: helix-turn-helix domain-containing protein, partial [Parvibaculaceae bacterium]